MNRTTANNLYNQALAAGLNAEVIGSPARTEIINGVETTIAEEHQIRISNPNGMLGPGILQTLVNAGVSIATSDTLLK